ncbi:NYN domain-containing protein [Patescibacteria group bacterium]|nr:NYN domain-containing protein [Patescibacteria group bacterium]
MEIDSRRRKGTPMNFARIFRAVILRFLSLFEKNSKMLVLIDLENILLNIQNFRDMSSLGFPQKKFDEMIGQLGKIAQVAATFVFGPTNTITRHGDYLRGLGFIPVLCPLVVHKKETGSSSDKRDTVDPTMIEIGRTMMSLSSGLTHLCIVSGDSDFVPLAREAQRRGLDVVVVAGNGTSLANELKGFACSHKGEQAVFLLKED